MSDPKIESANRRKIPTREAREVALDVLRAAEQRRAERVAEEYKIQTLMEDQVKAPLKALEIIENNFWSLL